jgi:hypothetical protein
MQRLGLLFFADKRLNKIYRSTGIITPYDTCLPGECGGGGGCQI